MVNQTSKHKMIRNNQGLSVVLPLSDSEHNIENKTEHDRYNEDKKNDTDKSDDKPNETTKEWEYVLLEFPNDDPVSLDVFKCSIILNFDSNNLPSEGSEVLVDWKKETHCAKVIKFGYSKSELITVRDKNLNSSESSEEDALIQPVGFNPKKNLKRKVISVIKAKEAKDCSTSKKMKNRKSKEKLNQSRKAMQAFLKESIIKNKSNSYSDRKPIICLDNEPEDNSSKSMSCEGCKGLKVSIEDMSAKLNSVHRMMQKLTDEKLGSPKNFKMSESSITLRTKTDIQKSVEATKSTKNSKSIDCDSSGSDLNISTCSRVTRKVEVDLREVEDDKTRFVNTEVDDEDTRLSKAEYDNDMTIGSVSEHLKYCETDVDVVEIISGCKVFVPRTALKRFESSSKTATVMARSLLNEIFKTEFLCKCSLYGRPAKGPQGKPIETRLGLYKPAVDAIIDLVMETGTKRMWKDQRKDIVKTLGNRLSEIRREKKSS